MSSERPTEGEAGPSAGPERRQDDPDGGDAGGYVHDPAAFDADGRRRADTGGAVEKRNGADGRSGGWLLVGALAVALLVIPAAIVALPAGASVFGIPYVHTLVALPMVPAIGLGLLAVWTAVRARRD